MKESLSLLTLAYLGKRDADKAAETIQARKNYVGKNAEGLYEMAIQSARCMAIVGRSPDSLSEADRERRARFSESAINLLKEAVTAGLTDLKRIKANKNLSILGEHSEFQKILAGLEKSEP